MVMKEAIRRLPMNEEGLPLGYYRADLIHPESVVRTVIDSSLNSTTLSDIMEGSNPRASKDASQTSETSEDASKSQDQPKGKSQDQSKGPAQITYNSPLIADSEAARDSTSESKVSSEPKAKTSNLEVNPTAAILVLDSEELQLAYVPLSYDEGYPSPPGGQAFWQRLPCEPKDAYAAFEAFIKSGATGSRRLFELVQSIPMQQAVIRARREMANDHSEDDDIAFSLTPHPHLPEVVELHVSLEQLQEWYYVYLWGLRAKAHDLYNFERLRRERTMLGVMLEEQHFHDASNIYIKVMGLILGADPLGQVEDEDGKKVSRFFRDAQPRVLVELLKLTSQMQRLSVGFQPAAPSTVNRALANPDAASTAADGAGVGADCRKKVGDSSGMDHDERTRRIAALFEIAKSRRTA